MSIGRGRPRKDEEEKLLSNGLLPRQWERLKKEARAKGYAETAPYLRVIIDEFFAQEDAEAASAGDTVKESDDREFEKATIPTTKKE